MTDEVVTPTAEATVTYKDEDIVYVDPELKKVVGLVEWDKNGNPKALAMPEAPASTKEGARPRKRETRYYPWGTYKSMKKVFQVEGKIKRIESGKTLEEILPKALEQAFWND